MRVTDVSIYSNNIEVVNFSVSEADPTTQFIVRTMIGLDSEELVPRFYGFGTNREKFYDFGMKARNIVIRLVLNPRFKLDESYSDLRDHLYKAVSSARTGQIALHLNSAGTTARVFGFITKFEVPYFTSLPEVQITIRCDDPMFRAVNPVLYEPDEISSTNPVIIPDSISTAPHGFEMRMVFTANVSSWTVTPASFAPEWSFTVTPSDGFLTGDNLHFSSDYTNKYLFRSRGTGLAEITHLIDRITPNSIWPIIFPGANSFNFVNIANFDWVYMQYFAAYWGV